MLGARAGRSKTNYIAAMKKSLTITVLFCFTLVKILAQPDCDRSCLTGIIDSYFKGLIENNTDTVPLAQHAKITENGKEKVLADTFWDDADGIPYRWDIVNTRLGDTGTETIIENEDGSYTMLMLRLKVKNSLITEVETIKVNKGNSGFLWGPEQLLNQPFSKELTQSYRKADRDSYYGLIAAAEGYWRAFQTNGTADYRPADLAPDADRYENGLHTTGHLPDGSFRSAREEFDRGAFVGRNLWDRRYAVVDEERGAVLCVVRFGLKDGWESQSAVTRNDRLVGEFFTVKNGMIQEIHAVLFNLDDSEPAGWPAYDYGPGEGGWQVLDTP